eukprot:COSAG01_NODE_9646_length_2381_cov_1.602103_1_plen_169_part_00
MVGFQVQMILVSNAAMYGVRIMSVPGHTVPACDTRVVHVCARNPSGSSTATQRRTCSLRAGRPFDGTVAGHVHAVGASFPPLPPLPSLSTRPLAPDQWLRGQRAAATSLPPPTLRAPSPRIPAGKRSLPLSRGATKIGLGAERRADVPTLRTHIAARRSASGRPDGGL